MEQFNLEKILSILFSIVSCGSIIISICNAVAWNHWVEVLDKCPYSEWYRTHENCGCILFGKKFDSGFRGGAISNCYYVTIAPIVTAVFSGFLAGYHIIRVFINKTGKPNDVSVERRFGEIVVTTTPTVREGNGSRKKWLILCGIAFVIAAYILGYAAVITSGYFKTCNEYRREVSSDFKAFGNQQAVIYGRLSCTAIYDFMDYLYPNYDIYNRSTFINTAITLNISQCIAWFTCILMIISGIAYFKIAQTNKM